MIRRLADMERKIDELSPAKEVIRVEVLIMNNNVSISGSTIANLSIGSQQTIGRINQSVGDLKGDPAKAAFADAMARLTEAIATSPAGSDEHRAELLEAVDFVLDEGKKEPGARKRVSLGRFVKILAEGCGAAGGLASVWAVAEPTVRAYLGL